MPTQLEDDLCRTSQPWYSSIVALIIEVKLFNLLLLNGFLDLKAALGDNHIHAQMIMQPWL
jgi:signal-transduction protein with cAMP-binding, CBS, and nucleotidyltransferase domain